jgi:hypothetical protein
MEWTEVRRNFENAIKTNEQWLKEGRIDPTEKNCLKSSLTS